MAANGSCACPTGYALSADASTCLPTQVAGVLGYIQQLLACVQQDPLCTACGSATTCNVCQAGYIPVGGVCQCNAALIKGCKTPRTCASCKAPFYAANATASAVVTGGACVCPEGYALTASGTMETCVPCLGNLTSPSLPQSLGSDSLGQDLQAFAGRAAKAPGPTDASGPHAAKSGVTVPDGAFCQLDGPASPLHYLTYNASYLGPSRQCYVSSEGANRRTSFARFREVLGVVGAELERFDAVCLATALHRMAALGAAPEHCAAVTAAPEFARLTAAIDYRSIGELLDAFARAAEAQLTTNMLHAYAKLEHNPGALLPAAAEAALRLLPTFTPQALSNTLWAFSKLGFDNRALFDAMNRRILATLPDFSMQNLANAARPPCCSHFRSYSRAILRLIAWAYGNLGYDAGDDFWEGLGDAAVRCLGAATPQHKANLVWALARLGRRHSALLQACEAAAAATAADFQPQALANFVWAYATLGEPLGGACLAALVAQAQRELRHFTEQNLSNLAWALATLGARQPVETEPAMVGAVAHAVAGGASGANLQELCNTAWALARLRHYDAAVMDRLASEACARMGSFCPQHLSNLVWALGHLMHDHAPLLASAETRALAILNDLSLQHISNLLWAYAVLGAVPERLAAACAGEFKRRLPQEPFTLQQLTNLLWSLCLAQKCDLELWRGIMAAVGAATLQHLDDEGLTQIFQVHVSQLQRDVARLLHSLGMPHELEALAADGLFSVDIALPGECIALEVDGPHHFTVNTRTPGGRMVARHRLLNAAGWAVISVPFFLWSGLNDALCESANLSAPGGALINQRILDASSPEEVLEVIDGELALLDAVNMSTAVGRMGKMKADAHSLALAIESPSFGELPARNVAKFLHGFATMGHHPGNAFLAAYTAQAAARDVLFVSVLFVSVAGHLGLHVV
ncbi:hypothetical protein WJX81_006122 [Elliptochloris bilobata]|uniref:RAP domain-containing protein n=1 Tax=Elliptochloris bilobata TaxID=381761 RepID=A0AAW1RCF9_9CHLO